MASVYGANLPESTPEVQQLLALRQKSADDRPEHGRMGLCATEEEQRLADAMQSDAWHVLVPLSPLGAGYKETSKTMFQVQSTGIGPVTHIRLNMGPDGGIARIRVYGEVVVRPESIPYDRDIDLAAVEHGGLALSWSNMHYGHPRNLIAPGIAI